MVVASSQLDELALRDELFDDFVVGPVDAERARRRGCGTWLRLRRHRRSAPRIEHGELTINLETYQAADRRPRPRPHLHGVRAACASSPPTPVGCFTRETLLSRVWGYEYYGGARTVDVHVRRLRAKLGEEHAHLIQTVRSVGYRFG